MPGILRRRLGSPHHRAVFNLPSSLSSPEKVQLSAAQRGVVLLLCTWQRRWLPEPPRTERGGSWERGWHGEGRYTHSQVFQQSKRRGKPLIFPLRPVMAFILRSLGATGVLIPLTSLQSSTGDRSALVLNVAAKHPWKCSDRRYIRFIFPPPKLRSDGEAVRASGLFNKSGC